MYKLGLFRSTLRPLLSPRYLSSASTAAMSKPTITLYTVSTPNGIKVGIFLEELKAAYPNSGFSYDMKVLDFAIDEQKEPWYLKINPNGRIPAIVHHREDGTDFAVFETAAILIYLSQRYDPERKLTFEPLSDDESEALQWIFFAHGGVGPMQGQSNHFNQYAREKIPYAIERYKNETKRLYSVLDSRLKERDYLAGPGRGKYSIADINVWPWLRIWEFAGVESLQDFPHLEKWLERIRARPGVQDGLQVPPNNFPKTKEEEDKVLEYKRAWIRRGNEQLK